MKKILIIEDDENILHLEKDYLEADGFSVDYSTDGREGLEKALSKEFDIILLDIMLPSMDGFEICKKIREKKDIPILLISAKKEENDKISGLGFGADDYIVKPFSPGELVARVKAHISRYERLTKVTDSNSDSNIIEIDTLRLNKETGEAFSCGKEIQLTRKEFEVLCLLAEKPEQIFTKNQLFEIVWGYDSLGDTSTLTVHINRIRDKLKEADPQSDYIKTVWGRGYKFK
ncbi:MAG: response regulator transcription factor [Acetobacter sp.]|nr:response regulator transcription factor [Bacteroides sp.]MCM1340397.1 response regulator transcription factor [Acetobacter sp.]MCM1432956.1 response regulator transcription factor [Clostridiales bacterium]